MAIFPLPRRYTELTELLPTGSYWDADGTVLPFRDSPYNFIFESLSPNAQFAVFVNDKFIKTIETDIDGGVIVGIVLEPGRQDVQIRQEGTGLVTRFYTTIRRTATWIAAYADVYEAIDRSIERVRNGAHIEAADSEFLEDVFGRPLRLSNDVGFLTDSYRKALRDYRQAYRFWGSRLAGLRQVVSGLTDVNPFVLPRAYRPRWVLGDNLLPDGNLQRHARGTATDLDDLLDDIAVPKLNAEALDFVHAGLAGNAPANIFPGPFTDPPNGPEQVAVVFRTGYDGGDVTITGVRGTGASVTETVHAGGGYPVPANEIVNTRRYFAEVTGATKASVGASGATVALGLAESRFVKVVSIGDHSPPGHGPGTYDLKYTVIGPDDTLSWDAASNVAVPIPASGRYTIGDNLGNLARMYGLTPTPGLATATYATGTLDRIYAEFNGKGIVPVELASPGPLSLTQIIDAFNNAFRREVPYGATAPTGTITVNSIPTDGETLTVDDGTNVQVFEFDDTTAVTAGRLPIDVSGGPSSAALALRIRDAIQRSGVLINASVDTSGSPTVVDLVHAYGGGLSTVNLTDGTGGDISVSGLSTGGDAPGFASAAGSFLSTPTGYVLRLMASTAGGTHDASSISVSRGGADATFEVFGLPLAQTELATPATAAATSLDCSGTGTTSLPTIPIEVIIADFFDDTAASPTVTNQPTRATALEVVFSPYWTGGNLLVEGLDCNGDTVMETFSLPTTIPVVASGVNATGGNTSNTVIIDVPLAIKAGLIFEALDGAGAGHERIRFAAPAQDTPTETRLRLDAPLAADMSLGDAWRIIGPVRVKGNQYFKTVTAISNDSPAGGAVGNAAVHVRDGADSYGYNIIVGRGLRDSDTDGNINVIDPSNFGPTALFRSVGLNYSAQGKDYQGYIRITGGTAYTGSNNGLHKIFRQDAAYLDTQFSQLRHERADKGQIFVTPDIFAPFVSNEGSLSWEVYAAGEVVRVIKNDTGSGVLTLDGDSLSGEFGGLAEAATTAERVEVERDMPFIQRGDENGLGTITVDVDLALLPPSTRLDDIFIESGDLSGDGGGLPDGWSATNVDLSVGGMTFPGKFNPLRLILVSAGAGDMSIQRDVPRALDYKDFPIRASFWVQQADAASLNMHIAMSFDGGGTWTIGAPVTVPGTAIGAGGEGPLSPSLVQSAFQVPYNATLVLVKLLAASTSGAGAVVAVEKGIIDVELVQGTFLGDNTIPRGAKRQAFGEILYVWNAEPTTGEEQRALGLPDAPNSTPDAPGHIDLVTNAHGLWERFDVSEFGAGDVPINIQGIHSESEWAGCTLTNMELVVGTPSKASYVQPTLVSKVVEDLAVTAPSNANIQISTPHLGPFPEAPLDGEILYEDGLPVPSSPKTGSVVEPWRFIANKTIQIASVGAGDPASDDVFAPAASYRVEYFALIRAESSVIDLGANYADYLWLTDAKLYRRADAEIIPVRVTVQAEFRADYTAALEDRSDEDKSQSVLTRDDGRNREIVPSSLWSYVSSRLVRIDASEFDPQSLYTFEYNAQTSTQRRISGYGIEVRSSATQVGVLSAAWLPVPPDTVVDRTMRYHQIRVTLSNVTTARDVYLSSMGFRGLHLFGSSPVAPGIITCGD